MKKILFILPVLALALILSGCGQGVSVDNGVVINGSIADLIKLGKNYRCEMQSGDDQIVSGTNYIAGDKLRADYKIKMEGQVYNGHSINLPDMMYAWIDEMPAQATKVKMSDFEKYQSEGEDNSAAADAYDTKYSYKCFRWTPDQSQFTPPTNVKFQDMSELLNQLNNILPGTAPGAAPGVGNAGSNTCSVCDMITDEAGKATCKKTMNCE